MWRVARSFVRFVKTPNELPVERKKGVQLSHEDAGR